MKRQVPTEREMTDMIATAFERLPVPDVRRLAAIEQRLLEQPRLRGRTKFAWWWLVGALLAGAASALWWAVNYDSAERQNTLVPGAVSPSAPPPAAESPTRLSRPTGAEPNSASEPEHKNGPVIYQRER